MCRLKTCTHFWHGEAAIHPHIPAWPSVFRNDVIAISPNWRGGTRQRAGLWSSTATAPS